MLYIIRHGLTDWNLKYKVQGQTDIPLNEQGIEMAKKAAIEYKNVHFDVCFCSPLIRAKLTADILLEGRDIPIIYDDRLKEMSFGEYEGVENCFEKDGTMIQKFFRDPANYVADRGAESFDELFGRTGEFLKEMVEPRLAKGEDVLIVGHGAMNSSIVSQRKGLARKDFWSQGIDNCKLMEI